MVLKCLEIMQIIILKKAKKRDQILSDRRKEGMGKFVITITGGSAGYKVLDNIQNNIISEQTN